MNDIRKIDVQKAVRLECELVKLGVSRMSPIITDKQHMEIVRTKSCPNCSFNPNGCFKYIYIK